MAFKDDHDDDPFEQSMMEMFESLSVAHPELIDRILARCPPEKRLQGLAAEERLRGLAPEELLRALSPEQLEQLKRRLH